MTGTAAQPLLEVEGLTIRLAGAPAALVEALSFSVPVGKTLSIVGESGSGKSLTALALMGLLPPGIEVAGGTARLAGEDLLALSPARLGALRGDRMAMIFQEPMTSLNPSLRVGEQIAEAVRRHRGTDARTARARAQAMLERVRIPGAARRMAAYPHELSGGMRQRVMIAMALANDPQLLIADEPTTALDVTIQAQILDLMAELKAETGAATILITHDLGVVAEMADLVAVIYAGRIVEIGPVGAIFEDPQHPYTIGLMASMPSFGPGLGPRAESQGGARDGAGGQGRLAAIPGTVPRAHEMPAGCRFAPRCPFRIAACAEPPPLAPMPGGQAVACWRAPLEAGASRDAPARPALERRA